MCRITSYKKSSPNIFWIQFCSFNRSLSSLVLHLDCGLLLFANLHGRLISHPGREDGSWECGRQYPAELRLLVTRRTGNYTNGPTKGKQFYVSYCLSIFFYLSYLQLGRSSEFVLLKRLNLQSLSEQMLWLTQLFRLLPGRCWHPFQLLWKVRQKSRPGWGLQRKRTQIKIRLWIRF